MSQISDVGGGQSRSVSAKSAPLIASMSDGDLADEHRGQGFARKRVDDRLKAIEAELDRRHLTVAKGKLGEVKRYPSDGLVDLRRLRADHPDLCRRYAQPGSDAGFWRASTLPQERRS